MIFALRNELPNNVILRFLLLFSNYIATIAIQHDSKQFSFLLTKISILGWLVLYEVEFRILTPAHFFPNIWSAGSMALWGAGGVV